MSASVRLATFVALSLVFVVSPGLAQPALVLEPGWVLIEVTNDGPAGLAQITIDFEGAGVGGIEVRQAGLYRASSVMSSGNNFEIAAQSERVAFTTGYLDLQTQRSVPTGVSQVLFFAVGEINDWSWSISGLSSTATVEVAAQASETIFELGPAPDEGLHAHVVANGVQASVSASRHQFDVADRFIGFVGERYSGSLQVFPQTDEIVLHHPDGVTTTCPCRAPDLREGDLGPGPYSVDWEGADLSVGQTILVAGVDVPGLLDYPSS